MTVRDEDMLEWPPTMSYGRVALFLRETRLKVPRNKEITCTKSHEKIKLIQRKMDNMTQ